MTSYRLLTNEAIDRGCEPFDTEDPKFEKYGYFLDVEVPENFEHLGENLLEKFEKANWPNVYGLPVSGGQGDDPIASLLEVFVDQPGSIVHARSQFQECREFVSAEFGVRTLYAYLDGSVIYVPSKPAVPFSLVLLADYHPVFFTCDGTRPLLIRPRVFHSLPIARFSTTFHVISRKTNARVPWIAERLGVPSLVETPSQKHPHAGVRELLRLETPTDENFYDLIDLDSLEDGKMYPNQLRLSSGRLTPLAVVVDWPFTVHGYEEERQITIGEVPEGRSTVSRVGGFRQEFTMEWIGEPGKREILFTGLSGSLTGQSGRPGVRFEESTKTLKSNLLLSRPDGSFTCGARGGFLMVVAEADERGLPTRARALHFENTAVRLPAGYWHSVPFPHPEAGKIHVVEAIAKTNASAVLDLDAHPITIQL